MVCWENDGQPPFASLHYERTVEISQVIHKGILLQHQSQLHRFGWALSHHIVIPARVSHQVKQSRKDYIPGSPSGQPAFPAISILCLTSLKGSGCVTWTYSPCCLRAVALCYGLTPEICLSSKKGVLVSL